MSRNNLELLSNYPDGEVYLSYWDSLHGQDSCLTLKDNKAYKSRYNSETDELEYDEIPNLIEYLITLAERISKPCDCKHCQPVNTIINLDVNK